MLMLNPHDKLQFIGSRENIRVNFFLIFSYLFLMIYDNDIIDCIFVYRVDATPPEKIPVGPV